MNAQPVITRKEGAMFTAVPVLLSLLGALMFANGDLPGTANAVDTGNLVINIITLLGGAGFFWRISTYLMRGVQYILDLKVDTQVNKSLLDTIKSDITAVKSDIAANERYVKELSAKVDKIDKDVTQSIAGLASRQTSLEDKQEKLNQRVARLENSNNRR